MDLTKLTKADKILFGAGIVFLISTFFDWFTISFGGRSAGGTGWDVGFLWGGLPFFIVLGLMIWVGLRRFSSVKLPTELPPLYLAGGASAFILVLFKFIIGETHFSRAFGLFLAVLAAAGVAFAGFLKFTEAGGDIDTLKAQVKAKAGELGDKK